MVKIKFDLEKGIIDFLQKNPNSSSNEIFNELQDFVAYATVKRNLKLVLDKNNISKTGIGKATKYSINDSYDVLRTINLENYFESEIDERQINTAFNFELIKKTLNTISLFNKDEILYLDSLHQKFIKNSSTLSQNEYKMEFERLAIDLSWKSSQIEGNTYSLLETELLLKEQKTASGKTKDEATMLLNHKKTLDFILENQDYINPLQVSRIEDIHRLLISDLGIDKNIRNRRVGISGTNYKPLDNEFQIKEALEDLCNLVNKQNNIFEKALLTLVLLSYIQAFSDGNKRTARIVSNAILIYNKHCPLSFRTVESIEYKKAMLLFYEQNNISAFKKIFMEQYEFAVNTYF